MSNSEARSDYRRRAQECQMLELRHVSKRECRARAGLLSKAAAQPELGNEGFWRLALAAQAVHLDTAFELLPRLIDARDPAVIHLAVAPQWYNLRADPRFNDCLARMKLRPV